MSTNNLTENCIKDLVSLQALPALWSSLEAPHIIESLLDALLHMLRVDFVYARLNAAMGGSPFEVSRFAGRWYEVSHVQAVRHMIDRCLLDDLPASSFVVLNPEGEGEVSIISCQLSLRNDIGVFVAGAQREDCPTRTDFSSCELPRIRRPSACRSTTIERATGFQRRP